MLTELDKRKGERETQWNSNKELENRKKEPELKNTGTDMRNTKM